MTETPLPPQGRRSDSWGPLVFFTWVLVGVAVLNAFALSRTAWDLARPIVIPARQSLVFGVDGPSDLTTAYLVMLGLSVLGSLPLAVLVTGLALTAVPDRRRHWPRLLAVVLTVLSLVAVMWWWSTDHSPDEGSYVPVGSAYYLIGAAVILGIAVAVVLELYLLVRPVSVHRPRPLPLAPAGWYLDPDGAPAWRWWDGTAWAALSPAVVADASAAGTTPS